jgi:phospholipase/lecithinase/hemolysin
MAAGLGVNLQPSSKGGTNNAIGGAATGYVPTLPGTSGPDPTNNYATTFDVPFAPLFAGQGIDAQVSAFLTTGAVFDPATSLFVLWGGPNNFFINPSAATAIQAAQDLASYVLGLYAGGARLFLVPNMPDLSLTPSGRAQGDDARAGLHLLSTVFNGLLKEAMDGLATLPEITLVQFDTFAYLNQVIAAPAAFGLTNVTDACVVQTGATSFELCSTPDSYLFWDGAHPTAAAHRSLGQEFADAVAPGNAVPEPSVLVMIGLGVAAFARRRRA